MERRRQLLLALTTLVVAILAGCIQPPTFDDQLTQQNINTTETAIAESSSLTFEVQTSFGFRNQTVTAAYNTRTETARFVEQTEGNRTRDEYRTSNRLYTWNDGEPRYVEDPFERPDAEDFVAVLSIGDEPINQTGTTTFDGRQVGVYEVTGDRAEAIIQDIALQDDYRSATVTFYATGDGRIVYASYQTADAGSATIRFTDFDNTVPSEPDWFDDAEERDLPPRAGFSFEEQSNGTLTITVIDDGNVDSVRAELDGAVMTRVDGTEAVITDPSIGDSMTVEVINDEYSEPGADSYDIDMVGRNGNNEDTIAEYRYQN